MQKQKITSRMLTVILASLSFFGGCEKEGGIFVEECVPGDFAPCVTSEGSSGVKSCDIVGDRTEWGECDTESQLCYCPSGFLSQKTCDEQGQCKCDCDDFCAEGDTEECSCPDGSLAKKTCEYGLWGDCECETNFTECMPGDFGQCSSPEGTPGVKYCNGEGYWEGCDIDSSLCYCSSGFFSQKICDEHGQCECGCEPCSGEGAVEECFCSVDAGFAERTCKSGFWGECECPPDELCYFPGLTYDCVCSDGSYGQTTCDERRVLGECNCVDSCPTPGMNEECVCPDGALGQRSCGNNRYWESCECV